MELVVVVVIVYYFLKNKKKTLYNIGGSILLPHRVVYVTCKLYYYVLVVS